MEDSAKTGTVAFLIESMKTPGNYFPGMEEVAKGEKVIGDLLDYEVNLLSAILALVDDVNLETDPVKSEIAADRIDSLMSLFGDEVSLRVGLDTVVSSDSIAYRSGGKVVACGFNPKKYSQIKKRFEILVSDGARKTAYDHLLEVYEKKEYTEIEDEIAEGEEIIGQANADEMTIKTVIDQLVDFRNSEATKAEQGLVNNFGIQIIDKRIESLSGIFWGDIALRIGYDVIGARVIGIRKGGNIVAFTQKEEAMYGLLDLLFGGITRIDNDECDCAMCRMRASEKANG